MTPMAQLRGKDRARLPDSAFAYVDSTGRRSLPIHDEAHVRNALARFERILFEDDAARARARTRLLRAAKRHGIVPLGFLDRQLRPEQRLPTGRVTLLMADVEGSSELLARLGDGYARVIDEVRRLMRAAVRAAGGHEVDARADEYFAAFTSASSAVDAAIRIQRELDARSRAGRRPVRVRIGIHGGRPTLTPSGYVGLAVNTVARLCAAGHGGQILVSAATHADLGESRQAELRPLGAHRLRGIAGVVDLFQVLAPGLPDSFPPLRA
jgi:class 3 adenylate cyclase